MPVVDIMPGVKLVQLEKTSVLVGCPPEIIKSLIIQKVPFPDHIVIPDLLYRFGAVQNATEFPLYYFLFVLGNYKKGKKLSIIGTSESVSNNRKLLRLSLLGPSLQEYASIGESKHFKRLYKESRSLALKKDDGSEYGIDDFVEVHPFQNGTVRLGDLVIRHDDLNVYSINEEKVDINFSTQQVPPYDLNPNFIPHVPFKFGVDVLGGGSGFTPSQPCSGLLLNYNSELMLVDCLPYLDQLLSARGISRQQVKALFLSHIHDDHCNMFPLLEFNDKIKFLGTKEIYWMAIQKLALQTNGDPEDYSSFFDFIELLPYKENDYYGMSIIPHYTVHSIPTIGAVFTMKESEIKKNLCFVADNKALPQIDELVTQKVVSERKALYLKTLYRKRFNLLFPDGGMGILHGDPNDSLKSKSDSVVFMHLEELPAEYDATFSRARSGKRYNLIESNQHIYHAYTVQTMQILHKAFPGISNDWTTAMMNDMRIVRHNIDDIIMKQGELKRGVIFIILSGRCRVKRHDGKVLQNVAVKEAGDFIGELGISSTRDTRSASVVAETPVTLCELDERLFYLFLQEEKRLDDMTAMWKLRTEIESFCPFSEFSDALNQRIARISKRTTIPQGTEIIHEGESTTNFYIVVQGSFRVTIKDKEVNTLERGGLFGEFGSISEKLRTATVTALEDSIVLDIKKGDINRIIFSTPALNFFIHQLIKRRSEELNDFYRSADIQ